MKQIFTFFFILGTIGSAFGSRPTVHASGLNITNIHCNKITLNWTNGNGAARMIVMKEGSASNHTPIDGKTYLPNSVFGNSLNYDSGNYIVFNGTGTTNVTITNLKEGSTYYMSIYEHDNNGSSVEYLVSGAPSISQKTLSANMSFTIETSDSCEKTNYYKFTNTSTPTVPGINYYFYFGPGDTVRTSTAFKHFNAKGYVSPTLRSVTNTTGCAAGLTKSIKIIPKKLGYIDPMYLKDSVQFFAGNYFYRQMSNPLQPFPMATIYKWWFGDGDSNNFVHMRKSYSRSGRFHVMAELTALIGSKLTNCKDTIKFDCVVLHNPFVNAKVFPEIQMLKDNRVYFINQDSTVTYSKWKFGDGDSLITDSCSHHYLDTGRYLTSLYVETNFGYKGTQFFPIRIMADTLADTSSSIHSVSARFRIRFNNPSNAYLRIELPEPENIRSIKIYDVSLREISAFKSPESISILPVDHLKDGAYFIAVTDIQGYTVLKKLIITH